MNLKKPKFWDYNKPNVLAYLLFPLAILLQTFVSFTKNNKKDKFKIKTICIGNIYLGGTGKTSLSIKINKILNQKKIKSCFVKKFYKKQIDEQKLLRINGELFLSPKRSEAIKQAEYQNYKFAICDDGLQDESIKYDLSFVCFNDNNWIGNGMTIPAGPLRENINNLKKYQHLFLNGNLEKVENLKREILKINPKINIHLGKYEAVNINEFDKDCDYYVFSGIGNHETFISMIKNYGLKIIKHIEFPDHYNYSSNDVKKILDEAKNLNCKVITTEKDYQRIDYSEKNNIKYIKSELKIIDEEKLLKILI